MIEPMQTIFGPVSTTRFSLGGQLVTSVDQSKLARAFESASSLPELSNTLGATPLDLAAALAVHGLEANSGLGPPLVTKRPSELRLKPFLQPRAWSQLLPELPETAVLNLCDGLLQIHDFWDDSHQAAQQADDLGEHRLSALWHAICHRREPDAGNAHYWYARVGKNPISPRLVELLEESEPDLTDSERKIALKLVQYDQFSDRVMISECLNACNGSTEEKFLRKLQKYEFIFVFCLSLEVNFR